MLTIQRTVLEVVAMQLGDLGCRVLDDPVYFSGITLRR
jgi:hypothetical protein